MSGLVAIKMPRSATFTFNDPSPYQAAIRGGEVDVLVTARGQFSATLTQIDCDRLWMQHGFENLPRVVHSALSPNRAFVALLGDPNQAAAQYCGMEVSSDAIVVGGPGSSRHIRTCGPCRWSSMSLPPDDLSAASFALLGRELRPGSLTRLVHPAPAHMALLVRLHAVTRHLAEAAPEVFTRPEVSRALEHELVHAMVTCLSDDDQAEVGTGWRHHSVIIRRFEEVLAKHNNRPMYLAEICAAVGASQSTLRACCCEHLGMGPVHYLWLRRMHLARRALQGPDPAATVTKIATEHGFGELGRFAVQYRALFRELPSAILRRSLGGAEDPPADLRRICIARKKASPFNTRPVSSEAHCRFLQPAPCILYASRQAEIIP